MKLRRTIFGVIASAALLSVAATQGAVAQIWEEYTLSIVSKPYEPQTNKGTQIPRSQFRDLFAPNVVDPDNGVAGPISLGFPFEYNNQIYTQIYVCVNGWISFQNPGAYITDDPYSLFQGQRPNLTIAPFFGDHYLRTPVNDEFDPGLRPYTPSTIRVVNAPVDAQGRNTTIIEWEDLNINYNFDPTRPDDPFAPIGNVRPQASSVGSFQVWLTEALPGQASRQGSIEFHYGPIGPRVPFPDTSGTIVKTSGASVGIEDEPAVPGGSTTYINAVAYRESGGREDSARQSRRLTRVWPPTGLPGRIFLFEGTGVRRIQSWGDGDADLTQLDVAVPQYIREDQRRFVTFLDVIRILRHQASRNVPFDFSYGRHGFHGDVNHDGRFYYSTRNYSNTGDSLGFNNTLVRYVVKFPTKSDNYQTPTPLDNSFSGFFFDADQFDASLIMLYLSAKLPVLPWLPDTLPTFSGKLAPGLVANDVNLKGGSVVGNRIEIPITFNGYLKGALGVGMEATNGTRIVEVRTMTKTDDAWVEAVASEERLALAAAGSFDPNDVIATLVVEANDNGDVTFQDVKVGADEKSVRKFNIYGATSGDASMLSLGQNTPNPFSAYTTTTIGYNLPADGRVSIRVFDVLGHEVTTLVNSTMKAGSYAANWNGLDGFGKPVASGVYYCRIEAAGESRTVAMQVSK
jgi:hypothetical protein